MGFKSGFHDSMGSLDGNELLEFEWESGNISLSISFFSPLFNNSFFTHFILKFFIIFVHYFVCLIFSMFFRYD